MNSYKLSIAYKRDVFFFYGEEENTLGRFSLESGEKINLENIRFKYFIDKVDNFIDQYDILPTVGPPLVSLKLKNIIQKLNPNDCDFFPVEILTKDNIQFNDSFFVMNILTSIECLDKERSEYKPLIKSMPNGPIKISTMHINRDNFGSHHIVRMKELESLILVDELFLEEI